MRDDREGCGAIGWGLFCLAVFFVIGLVWL
jgi:hypothetical protein